MNRVPADHRFCVAPMMDWTDRHCRFFFRQLSRRARLYTEMVTTGALLHGDAARHLAFHPEEHPLALQLGGSEARDLAHCARMAEDFGYDEVNLNCGCPSDRVQGGGFGACLMHDPRRVADGVAAMRAATRLPVTVKCRIGVDDVDPEAFLDDFVDTVAQAGCDTFIIHARKAWLQGLSPKQNRDVPPLDYPRVYRLRQRRPDLRIVLNGGIMQFDTAQAHLQHVDGVMLGRAVYDNPGLLAQADRHFYGATEDTDIETVVRRMRAYIQQQQHEGVPVAAVTRHMLGLFRGMPGARRFRRILGESARRSDADFRVLDEAIAAIGSLATSAPSTPQQLRKLSA